MKKMKTSTAGRTKMHVGRQHQPHSTPGKSIRNISDKKSEEKLALLAKGISHPIRVEIIRMLANKPPDCRCICGKIVNALPLAQSSVSQHLKVLRETGWIEAEASGTSVCYCLADGILDMYKNLMDRVIIYR
jgi:DNA-binding transcriptional ArsR family regulator